MRSNRDFFLFLAESGSVAEAIYYAAYFFHFVFLQSRECMSGYVCTSQRYTYTRLLWETEKRYRVREKCKPFGWPSSYSNDFWTTCGDLYSSYLLNRRNWSSESRHSFFKVNT